MVIQKCQFGACGKSVCSADKELCLEHYLFFKKMFSKKKK